MQKLDVGCGQAKEHDYIGMDIYPSSQVDVVHDFNEFPYPFPNDHFDEVLCRSTLEHVNDFIGTVVEIHRILKPGGLLRVFCPHFSGPDAYRDPTHKTFFAFTTFDRFTSGGSYLTEHSGLFRIEKRGYGLPNSRGGLMALPRAFANAYPNFYGHNLCWIMPAKMIYYELRAEKSALGHVDSTLTNSGEGQLTTAVGGVSG